MAFAANGHSRAIKNPRRNWMNELDLFSTFAATIASRAWAFDNRGFATAAWASACANHTPKRCIFYTAAFTTPFTFGAGNRLRASFRATAFTNIADFKAWERHFFFN